MKANKDPTAVDRLRAHLVTIPPGPIPDPAAVERLLGACWEELSGDEGGMKP